MRERRRFQRILIAVLLEFFTEKKDKLIGKGFITNLSESGLALETQEELSQGERVILHFKLLDSLIMDLMAKVIYSRGGVLNKAYGLEFCEINPGIKEKLKSFISARNN